MKNKNRVNQFDAGFDDFEEVPSSEFGMNPGPSVPNGIEDFSDNSFPNEPIPSYSPPKHTATKKGQLTVIFSVLGALLLAAAFFFLIPKGDSGKAAQSGTSAPAGATSFIAPGYELILNELLVVAEPDVDQGQIEAVLLKLDGAVVGYLPLINQYQIRFNTSSLTDLNQKKTVLETAGGIERVDYNYRLALATDEEKAQSVVLPAISEKTIGLMGCLPPEDSSAMQCFLLPSLSEPDLKLLPTWLRNHRTVILPDIRADQAASLLSQSGPQFFASALFLQENQDGSVSGCTTSFALRYQLSCLVNAGAETIIFPFRGPDMLTDDSLEAENKLNELFFMALEKNHPSFIICKAWAEDDYLIHALIGTDKCRDHLITVVAMTDQPLSVLDAAGTNRSVYTSSVSVSGADIAAAGGNCETAVYYAAVRLASIRSGGACDTSVLKSNLKDACGALSADSTGTVIRGLNTDITGIPFADSVRLVRLTAHDNKSGLLIPSVNFTIETTAGSFQAQSNPDLLYALIPSGSIKISASANNYNQINNVNPVISQDGQIDLAMSDHQATGKITGKIKLNGSGIREDLNVVLLNTESGNITLSKDISKNYELEALPGTYDLTVSGYNRTSVTVYGITVTVGGTASVPDITLSELSDLDGKTSGMIKDAMSGSALGQVHLAFYEGLSAQETGLPAGTAVTDGNGKYSISLPGGMYTAFVSKEGYRSDVMTVISEGETTIGNQDLTITPTLSSGTIRIVLDWGEYPTDLDSHLVNKGQGIHLFYATPDRKVEKRNNLIASLDVDALGVMALDRSNRVETTTIHLQLPGKYTFYIHDFSNNGQTTCSEMSHSGATVTVFLGADDSKHVFNVPDKPGTLWEVFTLENGILTERNIVTYHQDPVTVGN